MGHSDVDWIAEKASELLMDKVEEAPLDEEDINLAFEIFAEPRLKKISDSFSDKSEYTEAANKIRVKLHEVAKELNEEHWGEKQ
ncbi:hypothetical protein AKJ57_00615 [candidate division MSBL1 archaeon SCGC-AAA259A05]|uniref:Uncharacterized protein n=1 Tax=candidate division MSBL1 archaeon SCGC-AAA259A05 TaxID=1698259 RepID=A0A133UBQ5_9EURY|nr:hypothetical protein AKJ57_00615 [candidate division MSBL1 archaeon SCGC-AAA259A05]